MDIKTLMIGDWVYDTLSQTDIKVNRLCFETNPLNGICYAENLIPIPLASEILKKNGFKEGTYSILDKGGYKTFPEYKYINREEITDICKNLIKVSYSDENGGVYDISFGIGSHIFDLKYIHELQHALRLCGINKEIEL